MSNFYQNMQATADRLLTKFGQEVTISRVETATGWSAKQYDPIAKRYFWVNTDTSEKSFTEPTGSTVEYDFYAVVTSYKDYLIDGVNIKKGDLMVVAENVSFTPTETDTIQINSVDYKIVSINPVNPAGINICYKIQVRK